jgi:hypothetical protein
MGKPVTAATGNVLDLAGAWEAKALEVAIHTKDNGDQSEELRFDTEEQARLKGRRPQLTVIDPTGGYREETWTLNDSLLREQVGFWHLYQDSVYFRVEGEGARKLAYGVARIGSRLVLHTHVDYDGDGKKDDQMRIVLEKR